MKKREINDLEILWAIRDIPKSILNLQRKGILLIFAACIGENEFCYYTMKQLQEKMGASERSLRDHFHYLEERGFLIIHRPKRYKNKDANQYSLNFNLIINCAKKHSNFREQKHTGRICRYSIS